MERKRTAEHTICHPPVMTVINEQVTGCTIMSPPPTQERNTGNSATRCATEWERERKATEQGDRNFSTRHMGCDDSIGTYTRGTSGTTNEQQVGIMRSSSSDKRRDRRITRAKAYHYYYYNCVIHQELREILAVEAKAKEEKTEDVGNGAAADGKYGVHIS